MDRNQPRGQLEAGQAFSLNHISRMKDFTSMVRPFEQWAGVEVRSPRKL
jgi:hypothetical protein